MVKVPYNVGVGIMVVRESGRTNMFDVDSVIALAILEGYPETAEWISKNKTNETNYMKGIFEGFISDDKEDPHEFSSENIYP